MKSVRRDSKPSKQQQPRPYVRPSKNNAYYDEGNDYDFDYESEDERYARIERGERSRNQRAGGRKERDYDDEDIYQHQQDEDLNYDSSSNVFGYTLKLLFFCFLILIVYLALFPTNNILDLNYQDPEIQTKLMDRLASGKGFLMEKIGEGKVFLKENYMKVMGKDVKESDRKNGGKGESSESDSESD